MTMYKGEEVIVKTVIKGGKKTFIKQYFSNTVEFPDTTRRAYVIGNSPNREGFDLSLLDGVTYGCNALYRDFSPDFLICKDSIITQEIISSGYADKHVVYAQAKQKLLFDQLHLIPLNPVVNAGATALHIACMHGFRKIYLLGFDYSHHERRSDNMTISNMYLNTPGYGKSGDKFLPEAWPDQLQKVRNLWPDVEMARYM